MGLVPKKASYPPSGDMAGSQLVMASSTICLAGGVVAVPGERAEVLRVADGCCSHAVLRAPWASAGRDALRACTWPSPLPASRARTLPARRSIASFALGSMSPCVDSLQINIQAGDAMRRNAMQIGINQRLGKQRRIVGGHAHAGMPVAPPGFAIALSGNDSSWPLAFGNQP